MKYLCMFLIVVGSFFSAPAQANTKTDDDRRRELAEWVYQAAVAHASPTRLRQFPGHEETEEETHARYRSIAEDIAAVTIHRSNAALLLAFAIGESGLARDADIGPCFRGTMNGYSWKRRCDGGKAATIWQMHAVYDTKTKKELSVEDLFSDRRRAAGIFLRLALSSLKRCEREGLAREDQLSGVGLGTCQAGNASVRKRHAMWKKIAGWNPPKKEQ